jgi:hypothetical protein
VLASELSRDLDDRTHVAEHKPVGCSAILFVEPPTAQNVLLLRRQDRIGLHRGRVELKRISIALNHVVSLWELSPCFFSAFLARLSQVTTLERAT